MPDREVDAERGAVTVEAAIGLCSLIVVFGLLLAGLTAVTDQLRCTDAARETALLVARGQRQLAEHAVERIAPSNARLDVRTEGDSVSVAVLADPVGGMLPGVSLRGHAYAVLEPGVDGESEDTGPRYVPG